MSTPVVLRGAQDLHVQVLRSAQDDSSCSNCGAGPVSHFCAACGQRKLTEQDLTTAGFLRESFHELTSFDGRLWRTLRVLLTKPGLLAREYFDGRGGRYMKPLNLFVLINLVFFLIQPHTGLLHYSLASYVESDGDAVAHRQDLVNSVRVDRALRQEADRRSQGLPAQAAQLETYEVFRARFDDALQGQMKSMLIVSIPLFALAMIPLYAGRGRRYAEHLVFSVHTYAFFLLLAGVLITPVFHATAFALDELGVSAHALAMLGTERALVAVVVMGTYLYLGLRRMYADSRFGAAPRAIILFAVMLILIGVYHDALFRTTLAAL